MARLVAVSSLVLALVTIPGAVANPACAVRHRGQAECIAKCKGGWGWMGHMMGKHRWGAVMEKVEQSSHNWDRIIAEVCGSAAPLALVPTTITGASASITPSVVATPVDSQSAQPSVPSPETSSSASSSVAPSSVVATSTRTTSVRRSSSTPVPPSTADQTTTSSARPQTAIASTVTPTTQPAPPRPKPSTSTAQPPPAQTPASTGSSSGTPSSDIQAYLKAHNTIRANHGAAALVWSDDLARKAQQWANGCKFQHSGGSLGAFGENLAAGTGSNYGIAEAIKSWTDEVSDFNGNNPVPSHFTQVVWKGTQQCGCAVQECDGIFPDQFGKAKYYVCEYFPQGNVIGRFAANVQV